MSTHEVPTGLYPVIGETFVEEYVLLDGGYWHKCVFIDCRVEYHATASVLMGSNTFRRCIASGDFPAGWIAAFRRSHANPSEKVVVLENGAEFLN